jgi:ABC-type spermidine/putrescine transport system permease subunit I
MKNVDWPLAIALAIVFIVMSVVRWRYFRALGRRRERMKSEQEKR